MTGVTRGDSAQLRTDGFSFGTNVLPEIRYQGSESKPEKRSSKKQQRN